MPKYLAVYEIGAYEGRGENEPPSHYVFRERVEEFDAKDKEQAIRFANKNIPELIRKEYASQRYPPSMRPLWKSLEELELKLLFKVEEIVYEKSKGK